MFALSSQIHIFERSRLLDFDLPWTMRTVASLGWSGGRGGLGMGS